MINVCLDKQTVVLAYANPPVVHPLTQLSQIQSCHHVTVQYPIVAPDMLPHSILMVHVCVIALFSAFKVL